MSEFIPRIVHQVTEFNAPILLIQIELDNFTVIYGKDITTELTYETAGKIYGDAVIRGAACIGVVE